MFQVTALTARYTPSSDLTFPLVFMVLGLAGILLSMHLGITPPDSF